MYQYYESYRASVMRDILPQFSDSAKSTKTPTGETFYEHLTKLTNNITHAIEKEDKKNFLRWIKYHQTAVMDLLKSMVVIKGDPFYEGYKSFKFSDAELHFDNFVAVPRFGSEPQTKLPVVYASEMSAIIESKKKTFAKEILAMKLSGKQFVIIQDNKLIPSSYEAINAGTVRDWTARLLV